MQHRTQTTPELRVDKVAGPFPREVLVIKLIRLVEPVQVLGKILG